MRKILAAILCLAILVYPITALMEFVSEDTGISFLIPDGFTAEEAIDKENGKYGIIVMAEDGSVAYMIAMSFDEAYIGLNISGATEDDLIAIGEAVDLTQEEGFSFEMIVDDGEPYIVYLTEIGDKYVVVEFDTTEGFLIGMAAVSLTGEALTDDQIELFGEFLASLSLAE